MRRELACLTVLLLVACAQGADHDGVTADDSGSDDAADDGAHDGTPDDDGAPDDDGDGDDDGDPSPADADAINAYIESLGTPQSPASEVVEGVPTQPEDSGDYSCASRNLTETKQFAEIVAFAANSGSMYPGAILDASSIDSGLFTPRVLDRAPITFSASLEGVIDGSVSAVLDSPSLSAFRDAMGEILAQEIVGNTPANIHSRIEEVYSEKQLSLALGLDVGWLTGDIEASMRFDDMETRSRFVVDFTQTYYTVDVDPPGSAADFFAPDVTVEDVEQEMQDQPPAYVSSVSYGRIVYFAATSSLESQELRAALDFGFNGTVSVDGSVSLTHEEVLAQSEITAFILGGDGTVAVHAIYGVEELREFVQSGGTYSKESPGAAIAYKLAYLHDDSPARFSLTTDYEVEECARVNQDVRVALKALHVVADGGDAGDELELYGEIWAVDGHGYGYPLWEVEAGDHVTIGNGQSWPMAGEISSAILPVEPEPGESIALYIAVSDDDGIINPNDDFGTLDVIRPFEDGWRAEFSVPAAKGDQHIEIEFELVPVG
jgi:thiol-activated cytolysin